MKKVRSLNRQIIHAKKSAARKLSERRKRHRGRVDALREHLATLTDEKTQTKGRRTRRELVLPEVLSLSSNYDRFVQVIREFRKSARGGRRPAALDFKNIRKVSPAAALVLVAELDRWRRLSGGKLRAVDLELWDPEVRQLLQEMGFFKVLEVGNAPILDNERLDSDTTLIQFRTEDMVIGETAVRVREDIEAVLGGEVPNRRELFRAVSEAMTNSLQHAYPPHLRRDKTCAYNRWWMAGSYRRSKKLLRILFYDQGVGIPKTLPRKFPMEKIRGFFTNLGIQRDDASMIQAAIELTRSSTEQPHRGKGLPEIQRFVSDFQDARLRILSGRGEYIYISKGKTSLISHAIPLGGTLIQWEIGL